MSCGAAIDINALLAAGRLDEARRALHRHLTARPDDGAALGQLAKLDYLTGSCRAGLAAMVRAVALAPARPDLLQDLATMELEQGNHPAAIARLETLVGRWPERASAWFTLAWALRRDGRNDAAADAFTRVIELEPGNADARYNLGNALTALGRSDEALAAYEAALRLKPDGIEIMINSGALLIAAGREDEAETRLRHAWRLMPEPRTANPLANLLANRGRTAEAERVYRAALAGTPWHSETVCNLSVLLGRVNRLDEIAELLRDALLRHPDDAELWNATGRLHLKQYRLELAEHAFRRAIALRPAFAEALNNLGMVAAERGAEAAVFFRQALAIEPNHAGIHSNLLFALRHGARLSPEALYAEHRSFGERQEALAMPLVLPTPVAADAERRLRIGFVSPDFREHAVTFFFEPVLHRLDRKEVEIFLYNCGYR
ncbi:MAG: tetratricopeptide repeat protein, partial [Rhodospirillaceae bacterium]